MKRGVLFLAISEDKGQDLEGQERELRADFARMGVEVCEVVRVDGESRWKGTPPEKKRVLEMAQRRKFDVLGVWALDRWARRRKDGAREVFDWFPTYGVQVWSNQEPWLSTVGIPEAIREALGHLVLWLAEEESTRKSHRVKLRYETNRNRAAAGGGRAVWGKGRVPTLDDVAAILAAKDEGLSVRGVAGRTGIPKSTVQRVLSQRSGPEGGLGTSQRIERPEGALGTEKEVERMAGVGNTLNESRVDETGESERGDDLVTSDRKGV